MATTGGVVETTRRVRGEELPITIDMEEWNGDRDCISEEDFFDNDYHITRFENGIEVHIGVREVDALRRYKYRWNGYMGLAESAAAEAVQKMNK